MSFPQWGQIFCFRNSSVFLRVLASGDFMAIVKSLYRGKLPRAHLIM